MPRVAEIKEINGQIWARLETESDEGVVTLWTPTEIEEHRITSVRDFLIDQFNAWKDRQ